MITLDMLRALLACALTHAEKSEILRLIEDRSPCSRMQLGDAEVNS